MGQFMYFVPGVSGSGELTAAKLAELGLGHVPDGHGLVGVSCQRGPDEQAGLVFYAGPAVRLAPGYRPSEQDWVEGPVEEATEGRAKYWIGVQNDNPPVEETLRRRKLVDGESVELLRGAWTIPVARSLTNGATIPRRLKLGKDGRTWTLAELPEFTAICAAAERVWTAYLPVLTEGKQEVQFDNLELIEVCCAALAVNYRVGPVEISALGLLDTRNVWDIARALIDWKGLLAIEKTAGQAARAEGGTAEQKKSDTVGT